MTELEVLQAVKSAFDDIDTSTFSYETNFKDNEEWSSLTALTLITILDDTFGKSVNGEALSKMETIKDLHDYFR